MLCIQHHHGLDNNQEISFWVGDAHGIGLVYNIKLVIDEIGKRKRLLQLFNKAF